MSKLNFSNINEAYNIPSVDIKKTNEKISELTKKITESAGFLANEDSVQRKTDDNNNYKRIGNPDIVESNFCKNNNDTDDDLEFTFFKLMKSPRFEDVVKNYIYFKHPEWLLSSNKFVPSKESFGSTNLPCDDIKHYIIFFVISILLYLLLSLFLKKR
jgi:hypothetical protein